MARNRTLTRAGLPIVLAAGCGLLMMAGGCKRQPGADAPAGLPPRPPRPALAPSPASLQGDLTPAPPAGRLALEQALGMNGSFPSGGESEAAPDPRETIAGTITLPPSNRDRVARGETIFLAARRAGGPPGPGAMVAVQKLQAEKFPMAFAISARDAMIPGIPFEGHMSITVRVDKDGDALTRKRGDVYGQVADVVVGTQDVKIALDTVQAEDRTIATPDAVQRAMLPSGHP